MKKYVAVLLALAMIVGSMAGCTGGSNSSTQDSSKADSSKSAEVSQDAESSQEEADHPWELLDPIENTDGTLQVPRSNYVTYPISETGVELEYWLCAASNIAKGVGETKDTEWAQVLQERTGVKIQWTTSVLGSDSESFGVMTSSGQLPDIVEWEWTTSYNGGPSAAESDGLITYLNDYITEYGAAADLWQFLQDNPHLDKEVKDDNGNYYAFPFVRGTKYLQCTSGPIVRTDLLESVGIKADELVTIEDWHNALLAAKEIPGVEYPLICKNWGNLVSLMNNPFEFRPNMFLDYETGNIEFGYMTEGYKEFIQTLQQWLSEGLVDPDLLSNKTDDQTQAMLTGTSVICYGAGGGDLGTYLSSVSADPSAYAEGISFQTINFPVKNAGDTVHYGGSSYDYATTSKASAAITADCKNPEVAAKLLNYNYSKEGHLFINYGQDVVIDSEGQAHYSDKTMDYAANGFPSLATSMANVGRANMSGPFAQDPNYIFEYYATDGQKAALHTWNDYQESQSTLIPPITLTAEESSKYASLINDINTYVESSYGAWFALQSKVEDDWDNYISTLQGMGIQDAIDIYQAALNRYNAR